MNVFLFLSVSDPAGKGGALARLLFYSGGNHHLLTIRGLNTALLAMEIS